MNAATIDVGNDRGSVCPDPDCAEPGCAGECLLDEPESCCTECGSADPFASASDCHACRWMRSEIALSAEAAAGWDASP